jgi:flavin reductase (DIM6/NTAB) family NADH-FMN oxidoreductase RutF
MAAAWHTSISFKPPIYGVSVSPRRFTYQLVIKGKEFGVNFLPFKAAELIASVGGSSGGEVDKFERFNIATAKPTRTSVPIPETAYAA